MTANERKHRTIESLARSPSVLDRGTSATRTANGKFNTNPKPFNAVSPRERRINPLPGTKQEEETPELTESYRVTVERLRASRLPPALVLMHVKFGFRDGECCGDCASLGEIWLHSEPHGQPYCRVARSFVAWDPLWPACGRFRRKEGAA